MHLLDSCFCKLQQTDRRRKRPKYTFLGFHLPPTTFVYLLYKCAAIYFVAKQKKLQKSKNLVGKWMTKFSNPFKKNSTPSTKIIILHFEEHAFYLNWFCKQLNSMQILNFLATEVSLQTAFLKFSYFCILASFIAN